MKSKGIRYLQGDLDEDEGKYLITNDANGIGWRIVDFRILPSVVADLTTSPLAYSAARLSTTGGLGIDDFQWNNNTCLGVCVYMGGNIERIFDNEQIITTDLLITNMNKSAEISGGRIMYQVTLEQFDITPDEQVMATIKETAQSGSNS